MRLSRRERTRIMPPFLCCCCCYCWAWIFFVGGTKPPFLSEALFVVRNPRSRPNKDASSRRSPAMRQQDDGVLKTHRPRPVRVRFLLGAHSPSPDDGDDDDGSPESEEWTTTRTRTRTTRTTAMREKLRVGIAGAGAIAFGTAALLSEAGHDPALWSPSGAGTRELLVNPELTVEERNQRGSNTGGNTNTNPAWTVVAPRIATSAQNLVEQNDILIIALPANGHKQVFDAIAPHVRNGQPIFISSHSSFGALYLARRLRESLGDNDNDNDDAAVVPITAWGTTVCTARRPSGSRVRIHTVRQSVDVCTIPHTQSEPSLELCHCLFPQVGTFRVRNGILAITLSNLNPQNHLGIALGNFSRMEKGEAWYQSEHITPMLGSLLESLDRERLDIANALGLETKTIFEHFSLSFHVPIMGTISEMNQEIHRKGNDVYGPKSTDSRYITEDIPFGLVPTILLGQMVNRPATLHQSGVQLVSAMYGRDFVAENDLLPALNLEQYSLEELQEAALTGILKPHTSNAVSR